jgi:hypothetical protein
LLTCCPVGGGFDTFVIFCFALLLSIRYVKINFPDDVHLRNCMAPVKQVKLSLLLESKPNRNKMATHTKRTGELSFSHQRNVGRRRKNGSREFHKATMDGEPDSNNQLTQCQ